MEEEGVIVNNFCNYNFLRLSMDFEIFQVKAGWTRFVLT
jgi:exoribonuclease II